MSKQTYIVTLNSKYKDFDEWLADHDKKTRLKAIREVEDNVGNITWYHIHNGNLVEGANSNDDEPLYKYADISNLFKHLKEKENE